MKDMRCDCKILQITMKDLFDHTDKKYKKFEDFEILEKYDL